MAVRDVTAAAVYGNRPPATAAWRRRHARGAFALGAQTRLPLDEEQLPAIGGPDRVAKPSRVRMLVPRVMGWTPPGLSAA
jgi:hypothetical protein